MSELTERLDALRTLIQSHGFLTGDGLSNEVNIRIFCYAAEDEMPVHAISIRLSFLFVRTWVFWTRSP